MKKLFASLVAVLLLMAILAGCAQPAPEASSQAPAASSEAPAASSEAPAASSEAAYNPKDHPIAIGIFLKSHPTVQLMIGGFLVRAKELGYEPLLFAPDEADSTKAYGLLEAGMAQHKVQGLCQYIFDDSVAQYIKKYADQGIPVVTGHTQVDEGKYPGLVAWAAGSAVDYGAESAMVIGEQVGGKGTVAVTEGSFNPTEDAAAQSFIKTMKEKFPDIKVLEPMEEGFDTPTAIQRATAIMQANPDITGAFSTTGAGPSTWAGAQKNTGKKICAIGMDGNRPNLDLVKAGEVYAIVAQPLFEEHAKCAEMLDTILRGGKVEYANLMESPIVTKDKLDPYYKLLDSVDEAMSAFN